MNSKYGVQGKRKCENHEFCVCIAGFSECGCQNKSVMYETECRRVAVYRGKEDQKPLNFIELIHIQATLYLIRSEMGSQCSFSRRGVEWWWRGAKGTSRPAKF